jgi:hypothetical protein
MSHTFADLLIHAMFSTKERAPLDVISFAPHGARAGWRACFPMACAVGYDLSPVG